jgi:LacI family transcriptional regulator
MGNRTSRSHATQPVLSDVAKEAGVSTASVSRVLNTPDAVKPATREKVLQAIRKLGYLPDGAARALASGRLSTIGAIVPTLDNAIFAKGINALQRRLAQRNFTLLLASSEYDQNEELREVQALVVRGVDAMMFVGEEHDPHVYAAVQRKGIPYVNTWVYSPDSEHPCVGFNNRKAAQRVTDYLLDLGHTNIAMIAGVVAHNDRARKRVLGVRDALAARKTAISPADLIVLERPYDIREGREAFRMLFRQPDPPTAIICGNDVLAIGAQFEALSMGLKVPEDVSIVGFDDLPIAANLLPPLTTVRVPAEGMGRKAADYLVDRLNGMNPPMHTELDAELVLRGTTSTPRRRKLFS